MGKSEAELLKGTLDLLILKVLKGGRRHGWSISRQIRDLTEEVFDVGQGSLYPALHRLEAYGWIAAEWGVSELGRRARFYRLTRAGRRRLKIASGEWQRFAAAIDGLLQSPAKEPLHDEVVEEVDAPAATALES
jgi:transcriptional regulator